MLKYKKLSNYLQSISQKGAQIKSIVYSPQFPFNVASCYSLFSTCSSNIVEFEKFKNTLEAAQNMAVEDKYLFFIMLGEFINTGKIVGGGKIKRLIIRNADKLNIPIKSKIIKQNVQIRVRNNKEIKELESCQKDKHIQGVYDLNYEEYSSLSNNNQELFEKNLIVQSKSSCLPAWLIFQGLVSKTNFDIIDCCSAPGNKTIQLSQYIQGEGKILAFEKNPNRYNVLTQRIAKYEINNIKTFNEDFLKSDPKDKKFKRVKMILADPSCSGSGMLINFPNNTNSQNQKTDFKTLCRKLYNNLPQRQKQRVQSLKQFQLSILNHCAKFKPIRLSYSTCSIYQKQNQEVVKQFLEANPQYRVKRRPASISDLPRGFEQIGKDCVRMNPMGKLTDGFFVCIFKLGGQKEEK